MNALTDKLHNNRTWLLLLFVVCFVTGCARLAVNHPKTAPASTQADLLREKFDENMTALKAESDQASGWPSAEDCDGRLWAGLAAFAGDELVDLSAGETEPGKLERRPGAPCYSDAEGDKGSKSSISNDMITGQMIGCFSRRDLACLERLAAYGEAKNWVMGTPYPEEAARVVLRPSGIGMLGRMLYAVSHGAVDKDYRHTPALFLPVLQDYEKHLQVISIITEGEIDEAMNLIAIDNLELMRLSALVAEHPNDGFFVSAHAVYSGRFERAFSLLLDPNYQAPSYVRGAEIYKRVHWLVAAKLVLDRVEKVP